jgi:hypothetical protein
MKTGAWVVGLAVAVLLLVGAGIFWRRGPGDLDNLGQTDSETYTIERTDYRPPQSPAEDVPVDDRLEDKHTTFDPERVDRRPLGDWRLNLSEAVIRLDVPLVKPDTEAALLALHPSYAAAIDSARSGGAGPEVLPSVNLIDGKAKQFDDGLYAALDQAYYTGLDGTLAGHVQLIRRLYDRVGPQSVAAPYLAAGLRLGGEDVPVASPDETGRRLRVFLRSEVRSKPIGFYTWSPKLSDCFRFLRFFQQPLVGDDLAVARALAEALAEDPALLADYRRALGFYSRLTNPLDGRSVADLIDQAGQLPPNASVAFFPASTSRETELFRKLFPEGLPPGAVLMRELIRRIRSGEVDLTPRPDSGWYDYQVHALETLLVPEAGPEHDKLLLTAAYKKRMLEAFQALMTKRRETHVRQLAPAGSAAPAPLEKVTPRLRVEPCPSYFLRTARAYAFLADVLDSAVGADALKSLHGLREGGQREQDLHAELGSMHALFYGLYLLSCEDIGMVPELREDEPVDRPRCEQEATEWLARWSHDPDLAADTRVAVPLYIDPQRNITRLWATLGVRLTKLEASFARPPRARPKEGPGEWEVVEPPRLETASYLIPVDEFAEVELKGLRTLTRPELRAVCDAEKTKEAIVAALQK